MTEKTYHLRAEAVPFSWAGLTKSQKAAFYDIATILNETIKKLKPPSEEKDRYEEWKFHQSPFQIDANRSSRMVLLSGERGAGKTSVLISLLYATTQHSKWLEYYPTDNTPDEDKTPQYENLPTILEKIKNRIVWLETIDLEALTRTTNLLGSILIRIENAISRTNRKNASKPFDFITGALERTGPEEDPVAVLQKLKRDIALAWDGNIAERGAHLDPEPYAMEIFEAEEARLRFTDRLGWVLAALAEKFVPKNNIENPLFILPIDDFDLNPERATDLLRLLRMLSVPRLFFMILGKRSLAEVIMSLHRAGKMGELVANIHAETCLPISAEQFSGLARSIAADGTRKLLPPAQSIEIELMSPDESIRFKPFHNSLELGSSQNSVDEPNDLKNLLNIFSVEIDTALKEEFSNKNSTVYKIAGAEISSFYDFLQPYPIWRDKAYPMKYSGSNLLRSSPRHIADLWFSLKRISEKLPKKTVEVASIKLKKLIGLIGSETLQGIQEDPHIMIKDRQLLISAIQPETDGEWLQEMSGFCSLSTCRDAWVIDNFNTTADTDKIRNTLHANRFSNWIIAHKKGGSIKLSTRTTALLVTLSDLLALKHVGGLAGHHPLQPNNLTLDWAVTEWDLPGDEENPRFSWPAPKWTSFWEFEFLADGWWWWGIQKIAYHASKLNSSNQNMFLSLTWITIITMVLRNDETDNEPFLKNRESFKKWMDEFINKINNNINNNDEIQKCFEKWIKPLYQETECLCKKWEEESNTRRTRIESWLMHLALLLAPEYNLPITIIKKFLPDGKNNTSFENFVKTNAPLIRRIRCINMQKYIKKDAPETQKLAMRFGIIPTHFMSYAQRLTKAISELGLRIQPENKKAISAINSARKALDNTMSSIDNLQAGGWKVDPKMLPNNILIECLYNCEETIYHMKKLKTATKSDSNTSSIVNLQQELFAVLSAICDEKCLEEIKNLNFTSKSKIKKLTDLMEKHKTPNTDMYPYNNWQGGLLRPVVRTRHPKTPIAS